MRHIYIVAMVIVSIALALWLTGCGKEENISTFPAVQESARGITSLGMNGTTLVAKSMDVACLNFFKWTFEKSMDQTPDSICESECNDVEVTVKATKGMQVTGFNGKICIQNMGEFATENLAITVNVMKSCEGGDFVLVREAVPVSVSLKPVLTAGESYCYGYAVNVAMFGGIDPNCVYKIVANVTITNFVDHLGETYGITPEAQMQGCPPVNDCVSVMDVPGDIMPSNPEASVAGWNITVSPPTLQFCESGTAMFILHVCNNGVPTEETFRAENRLMLDGQIVATAYFYLSTLDCTPPGGCSRTIGFYKTHAVDGLYGNNPDMVSAYLPIHLGTMGGAKTVAVTVNTQVVSIMKREGPGGSSNGILKLYAQLLGAKLNIAGANGSESGTNPSCIAAAITEADAFLATHDAFDWSSLSQDHKNMVLGWMSTFDQYNNGMLCVSHCD